MIVGGLILSEFLVLQIVLAAAGNDYTGQQRCSSQRMHICDNLKFLNPTILIRFAL